jgi:hypothetical protein
MKTKLLRKIRKEIQVFKNQSYPIEVAYSIQKNGEFVKRNVPFIEVVNYIRDMNHCAFNKMEQLREDRVKRGIMNEFMKNNTKVF